MSMNWEETTQILNPVMQKFKTQNVDFYSVVTPRPEIILHKKPGQQIYFC